MLILTKTGVSIGAKLIEAMASLGERLWVAALAAVLLCGCGKNQPKAEVGLKAFDSAAPEIKQAWDTAQQAAARGDYGLAISTLRALSRQGLSPELGKTAYDAIVVYEGKLREAARKGDPAALNAMQTLGIKPTASGP